MQELGRRVSSCSGQLSPNPGSHRDTEGTLSVHYNRLHCVLNTITPGRMAKPEYFGKSWDRKLEFCLLIAPAWQCEAFGLTALALS